MWRMSLIFITGVINHPGRRQTQARGEEKHGNSKKLAGQVNNLSAGVLKILSVSLLPCVPGCYQSAGCRNIPENVSLLSPSVSRQTREQQIAGIRPRFLPTLKTNGRGPWTWNIAFKNISESEFYDWLTKGTFRHLPKCILSNKLPFSALKCHCNGLGLARLLIYLKFTKVPILPR